MTAFNQYLKALRERKCLDIGAVAKHIGVHRHTQSNYEDRRDPPIDYLVDFAELVDVPFVEILEKRLNNSKAKDSAISKALASINSAPKQSTEAVQAINELDDSIEKITLIEVSHEHIPSGALLYVDTKTTNISNGSFYCFKNMINNSYYVAQLFIKDGYLWLEFGRKSEKPVKYATEGQTDIKIILNVLGFIGKVIKAELNL